MLKTRLLSSLHKVFPDKLPEAADFCRASILQNEAFSFQVAYKFEKDDTDGSKEFHNTALTVPLYAEIETDLPINAYRVDYVPLLKHSPVDSEDELEISNTALYPDMLMPRKVNPEITNNGYPWEVRRCEADEKNPISALSNAWQSLWFTVNEGGACVIAPGEHIITARLFSQRSGECLSEESIVINVISACLPEQKLLYTTWLHCDCIADIHNVPLFGDEFFAIFKDYAKKAAINGMNMMLLPAFTPPLDTPVGKERKTTQLVKIKLTKTSEKTEYRFDFSLMKRYMDICREVGITHLEHCHLFTQWGAEHAPKIIAELNGVQAQIFGWDTDASDGEYTCFLSAYLPALRDFLKNEGLDGKILFHISDEPPASKIENYIHAKSTVEKYIDGCICADALSDYEYYRCGTVKTPIVCTSAVNDFIGKCDDLWCYYTGGEVKNHLSNRLTDLPSHRNRIIGMQMYRYKIKGFLNWGFNYCYGPQSYGIYDHCSAPVGITGSAGGAYIVYPSRDGSAIQSIRMKVFCEGMYDMRALELLETLMGREKVEKLLDELFGETLTFNTCATSAEQLLCIREAINKAISDSL